MSLLLQIIVNIPFEIHWVCFIIAGSNVEVYLRSGVVYYDLQRFTSARSHLNKAIALKPDLSKAYKLLGDIACKRRLFKAGQGYYDSALSGDLVGVDKKELEGLKKACVKK